jgi:hypothetical protein
MNSSKELAKNLEVVREAIHIHTEHLEPHLPTGWQVRIKREGEVAAHWRGSLMSYRPDKICESSLQRNAHPCRTTSGGLGDPWGSPLAWEGAPGTGLHGEDEQSTNNFKA